MRRDHQGSEFATAFRGGSCITLALHARGIEDSGAAGAGPLRPASEVESGPVGTAVTMRPLSSITAWTLLSRLSAWGLRALLRQSMAVHTGHRLEHVIPPSAVMILSAA
jgi:hypothetical protein